ncbi:hypothetical protein JCM8202v2_001987 [Rhodotorula sphaerocarpa]
MSASPTEAERERGVRHRDELAVLVSRLVPPARPATDLLVSLALPSARNSWQELPIGHSERNIDFWDERALAEAHKRAERQEKLELTWQQAEGFKATRKAIASALKEAPRELEDPALPELWLFPERESDELLLSRKADTVAQHSPPTLQSLLLQAESPPELDGLSEFRRASDTLGHALDLGLTARADLLAGVRHKRDLLRSNRKTSLLDAVLGDSSQSAAELHTLRPPREDHPSQEHETSPATSDTRMDSTKPPAIESSPLKLIESPWAPGSAEVPIFCRKGESALEDLPNAEAIVADGLRHLRTAAHQVSNCAAQEASDVSPDPATHALPPIEDLFAGELSQRDIAAPFPLNLKVPIPVLPKFDDTADSLAGRRSAEFAISERTALSLAPLSGLRSLTIDLGWRAWDLPDQDAAATVLGHDGPAAPDGLRCFEMQEVRVDSELDRRDTVSPFQLPSVPKSSANEDSDLEVSPPNDDMLSGDDSFDFGHTALPALDSRPAFIEPFLRSEEDTSHNANTSRRSATTHSDEFGFVFRASSSDVSAPTSMGDERAGGTTIPTAQGMRKTLPSFLKGDAEAAAEPTGSTTRVIAFDSTFQMREHLRAFEQEGLQLVHRPGRERTLPSLIVDPTTCVLLERTVDLLRTIPVAGQAVPPPTGENLLARLDTLREDYDSVFLVLEAQQQRVGGRRASSYSPPVVRALQLLAEHVTRREQETPGITIKVALSRSPEDTASIIRRLVAHKRSSVHSFAPILDLWGERSWLPDDPSEDETRVLGSCQLNELSAAAVLADCSAEDFVSMSAEDRAAVFGPILGQRSISRLDAQLESSLGGSPKPRPIQHLTSFDVASEKETADRASDGSFDWRGFLEGLSQ